MATLEKIIYNQDTGTEAIQKLDRNQRKINDDVKIINMDGVNQQLTNLASKDTAQQQQIDTLKTLTKSFAVELNGKSLIDYAKSLNISSKVSIQISGATDTPTSGWYYAEITVHCYATKYINIMLYSLVEPDVRVYSGAVVNTSFTGWKLLSEVSGTIEFANGWSQFVGHQKCKVSRIGNRCFLSGLATKGLIDGGTVVLTVPPFFRPTTATNVITHDAYGFYMDTTGRLILTWHRFENTDSWYSLDGLSWEVE